MQSVEDFYTELFQEVVSRADGAGIYKEEAFFEIVTERLVDACEFDGADYTYFNPSRGGIRVDGYCGDPRDSSDYLEIGKAPLGLIVLDFNQADKVVTLTNAEMQADFRRLENFVTKARSQKFRNSLETTDPGYGLADMINARWGEISRLKLFLITNKKLSGRVEGKEVGSIGGIEVVYNVWDISRLMDLEAYGTEREPLLIDFKDLPGGPLRALRASAESDKNQIYLAAIPGIDLAEIYDRWGTRLLEQNVRVFLQARSNVNKGIKHTLEEEPELFFSFNNGITATAEYVSTKGDGDSLYITGLLNLQIVNGGQTTASIYSAYKRGKDLSKVFVQMKLSVVSPDDAKYLVPLISKYANSQNKVSSADFSSNHPFHVRIEQFSEEVPAPARDNSFNRTKWFYERARGSYNDAQAYLSTAQKRQFKKEHPKNQTFTKTDLAKYLMVWTDKAYMVNLGAQKNFTAFTQIIEKAWDEDNTQFNKVYFEYLVAKKIIFDRTTVIVQHRDWYEAGGYRSQHVVFAIGGLANAVRNMGKAVNFLAIWNRQDLTPAFERALGQAADAAHEVLMNPAPGYRNISEWAKKSACWEAVKKVKVDWDPAWLTELISQEADEKIRNAGARNQKDLSGSEAQAMVADKGPRFWKSVLDWCIEEGEATSNERILLRDASDNASRRAPSERDAINLVRLMERLEGKECPYQL